jgi:cyclic pyranopterin monophosphate synthase
MADIEGVVYPFEDTGDDLSLLPLAARRALDRAGLRLSLDAYQGLPRPTRDDLARAGAEDKVDAEDVERIVRRAAPPATRIKPVPDPDPLAPPEQLNHALGVRRAVAPAQWAKLRSLDRYALVHVMRRSIAHNDPGRLEAAAQVILKPKQVTEPRRDQPAYREPASFRDPPQRDRPLPPSERPAPLPAILDPRAFETPGLDFELPRARSELPRTDRPHAGPPPSDRPNRIDLDSPFDSRRPAPQQKEIVSRHLSPNGELHMVDVGGKAVTHRRATATGIVRMQPETASRLARHDTPKGEVLATARVAGVMAAKKASELIPLCHAIALTRVEILIDVEAQTGIVTISAVAEAHDRTGVEMEALTAVSVAALTIYDMLKGLDKEMSIDEIRLLTKSGGRTGDYVRRET